MPVYDLRCKECDEIYENFCCLDYREAKEQECPICGTLMDIVPSAFNFEVKGSARTRRQILEARFKRREKRIERELTKEQQERLAAWCDKHGCRKRY